MLLKALNHIIHDGAGYEAGAILDVADDDQAQALLASGSAEAAPEGAEAPKPKGKGKG